MKADAGSNHPSRRLDSWKEIAQFFGRDERTVRRWEGRRGLPVCRLPGGGKTTVFAYVGDLDEWLRNGGGVTGELPAATPVSTGKASASRRRRLSALVAAILAVAASVSATIWIQARHKPGASTSAAAYGFYLKGLYSWQTRTAGGLVQAIGDFNKSIVADRKFAPAYAGLADCYDLAPEYSAMPAEVAFPKAAEAARRAIALDSNLAEAHAALAFVDFWWSHDIGGAMGEFRRALQLEPRSSQTHHWYATTLAMLGDNSEALAQIGTAEELAPGSTAILLDKGLLLADAGRLDQGLQLMKEVETAEPGFAPVHAYLASVYGSQRNEAAELREMRLSALLAHDGSALAVVEAGEQGLKTGGPREMHRRIAATAQALYQQGKYSPYRVAEAYAAIGDRGRIFSLLDSSVERHESVAMGLRIEGVFYYLHRDPRFAALLAREGLPPLSAN